MNEPQIFKPACAASLLLLAITLLSGCKPAIEHAVRDDSNQVSLQIADNVGYSEAIANQRGNVVLVDFWATWCPTCVKQFPHTVELFEKHRDKGLVVLSVSLDQPGAADQVRDYLRRNNAVFPNLLSKYESPMAATEAFELPGPIPCYRVYDRSGELQHEFSVDPRAERQFTFADIETAILRLL